jgi:hypothetical protein
VRNLLRHAEKRMLFGLFFGASNHAVADYIVMSLLLEVPVIDKLIT